MVLYNAVDTTCTLSRYPLSAQNSDCSLPANKCSSLNRQLRTPCDNPIRLQSIEWTFYLKKRFLSLLIVSHTGLLLEAHRNFYVIEYNLNVLAAAYNERSEFID